VQAECGLLEDIIRFLNAEQIRATYGAVADLVGGIPRGVGARLTRLYARSPEASWVVNESSGLPTGYQVHERHAALFRRTEIIRSGSELERRLARWSARSAN
jgi:alkylated DNA nucleotide flippase Atl1